MLENIDSNDLYDAAVGDGTPEAPQDQPTAPLVVESNASNYGASALPPEGDEALAPKKP